MRRLPGLEHTVIIPCSCKVQQACSLALHCFSSEVFATMSNSCTHVYSLHINTYKYRISSHYVYIKLYNVCIYWIPLVSFGYLYSIIDIQYTCLSISTAVLPRLPRDETATCLCTEKVPAASVETFRTSQRYSSWTLAKEQEDAKNKTPENKDDKDVTSSNLSYFSQPFRAGFEQIIANWQHRCQYVTNCVNLDISLCSPCSP